MSVVLVDYFCRNIKEPEVDEALKGVEYESACIQSLYPSFEEGVRKSG